MSKIKLILVFFLINIHLIAKAQVLQKVQSAFNNYQENVFQEKIFVHTDKETYITGEILWFKIYSVDATNNHPTSISKVAYIELLNFNNIPVLQAKISLKNSSGNGSFYIPSTLLNGYYKLRAYTNWMKNFGSETFFEKRLSIFNPLRSPNSQSFVKSAPALHFFPEGGDMVEGILCNVAFKATDAYGKGIDVSGVIVNQQNDTVAKFQTFKFGIGKFKFTPLVNVNYKVIASISGTKEIIIQELPLIKKQGYTLSLEDKHETLLLNVKTNINNDKLYLAVHNNNTIIFSETAKIVSGKAVFSLDKEKLTEGLSFLTVFNESGVAVAERLYFKKFTKKLAIEVCSEFLEYTSRKKVNVDISTQHDADLSIAVSKIDSLQDINQEDIVSYILLKSELKGNIEHPNYYFLDNDIERTNALDNLLLTQGWRRFNWNSVLEKGVPQFKFLPEFNGHLINARITDPSGKPQTNMFAYLGVLSNRLQFYNAISDSTGTLFFNTKDFLGFNEIVIQTNANIDSTSTISIQSPFSEEYNKIDYPTLKVKLSQFDNLKQYSLNTQIQNTFFNKKINEFYCPEIDSSRFYGSPFKTYKVNDYTKFNTIEEVLREYVSEVFVSKKQKKYHLDILGKGDFLNGDPLILFDGIACFDIDKLMGINPSKIEKLEIVNDKYYYGLNEFNGILNFVSVKSNLNDIKINPNAIVLDYEGMQLQREFYTPSYETPSQLNNHLPDFRNVLYWNPNININKSGKERVSFYTSDFPGTYLITVQGISKQGSPGVKYFKFEVKK